MRARQQVVWPGGGAHPATSIRVAGCHPRAARASRKSPAANIARLTAWKPAKKLTADWLCISVLAVSILKPPTARAMRVRRRNVARLGAAGGGVPVAANNVVSGFQP